MKLSAKIEAVLFFKGEPVLLSKLASWLKEKPEDLEKALQELEESLGSRGLVLSRQGEEVALGTAPEASALIENILQEELRRDLGRAGLETLALIAYYSPVSRAEIDYVRGVSSNFIVRSLLVRGLIERIENPQDRRGFLYRPTLELLNYLGVKKLEELPEYKEVQKEIILKIENLRQTDIPASHA